MGFDASEYNRWGMDQGLGTTSFYAVSPYAVYLYTIANDMVDVNDTDANRVVSIQRITVGDGYAQYSSGDGYLNPILTQQDTEQLIISNGQLTSDQIMLGPLVFPYTTPFKSGGFDPTLFQPAIKSNNNLQVYLQIQGVGLSPVGNFFEVDAIQIDNMSGLSYTVLLKSNTAVII